MHFVRVVVILAVLLRVESQTQLCLHSFTLRRLRLFFSSPDVNLACSNGEFVSLTDVDEINVKYIFDDVVLDPNFREEEATLSCEVRDRTIFLGKFSVTRADFDNEALVGESADRYTLQLRLCGEPEETEPENPITSTREVPFQAPEETQPDKPVESPEKEPSQPPEETETEMPMDPPEEEPSRPPEETVIAIESPQEEPSQPPEETVIAIESPQEEPSQPPEETETEMPMDPPEEEPSRPPEETVIAIESSQEEPSQPPEETVPESKLNAMDVNPMPSEEKTFQDMEDEVVNHLEDDLV